MMRIAPPKELVSCRSSTPTTIRPTSRTATRSPVWHAGAAARARSRCSGRNCRRAVRSPRHRHDHIDVFTVDRGGETVQVGDERFVVGVGDSVVVPTGALASPGSQRRRRDDRRRDAGRHEAGPRGRFRRSCRRGWDDRWRAPTSPTSHVFDGARVRPHHGVLVDRDRIAWVGPHARARGASARRSGGAVTGRSLTPGLIDCRSPSVLRRRRRFRAEAAGLTPRSERSGERSTRASIWRTGSRPSGTSGGSGSSSSPDRSKRAPCPVLA